MNKSARGEVTGAEAGLSGRDQMLIALREIVRRGGEAQMSEIYGAVEDDLGGYSLSDQGKASLRRTVNHDAVQAGYVHPHDPGNPGWRITQQGLDALETGSQ